VSIIQEALKKAERQIKDMKQASSLSASSAGRISSPPPGGPAQEKNAPATGRDPKAVAILLVILIVTAVLAASQLFPKKNIFTKPAAVPLKVEEFPALSSIVFQPQQPAGAAASSVESTSVTAAQAAPEFVLNGIMYLEGSPRAIINDSMVEEGEMVNGARVVKIDKKKVLLEYDGAEIILDLK
jgi:hypothetical protein